MKKTAITYHTPGGILWKVLPDESCQYLVIESRDGEKRKTLFSVLSLEKEKFLVKEIPAAKSWWIGLKAVGQGKIVFQGYKELQTPEPMGVYVSDLHTGKLCWKEEEKLFYAFAENTLLLTTIEDGKTVFYSADPENGKMKTIAEESVPVDSARETSMLFPLLYDEDNAHYKTIVGFLQQNDVKPSGPIEYLEYQSYVLIAFYVQEGKKWKNILWALDEEGELVLNEQLSEGEGIGMSSFFICGKKLIYIKDKTSLALVEL
ncbi:MAG TPA: DUF4905 domain-containing protein [Cytophagaceae bacterium]|nr:DUF4905 domain-containing protein [Cytophagaceae bacterium]